MPKRKLVSQLLPIILTGLAFAGIVIFLRQTRPFPAPAATPAPALGNSPAVTPAPTSSAPAALPTPAAPSEPVITSPASNEKVTSPLTITGTVPAGWMFEGGFPIKLVDKQRNLIVQGVAREKVPGSWSSGQPVAFTATLTFTTAAKSGFLILEKDNPSGLPENDASYQIPLKFSN